MGRPPHRTCRHYQGPPRRGSRPYGHAAVLAARRPPGRRRPRAGIADRTYDWDRIDHARDQAFGILAEILTGHPVDADDPAAAKALHREVIDRWSSEPGRTAADAAHAFRTAAVRAEHALF